MLDVSFCGERKTACNTQVSAVRHGTMFVALGEGKHFHARALETHLGPWLPVLVVVAQDRHAHRLENAVHCVGHFCGWSRPPQKERGMAATANVRLP